MRRKGLYLMYPLLADVDDRSVEQSLRAEVSSLKERVEELEEELAMEENRGWWWWGGVEILEE